MSKIGLPAAKSVQEQWLPQAKVFLHCQAGQLADTQALVPGEGAQILLQKALKAQFSHWLYLSIKHGMYGRLLQRFLITARSSNWLSTCMG